MKNKISKKTRLRRFAKGVGIWLLAFGVNPEAWRYLFRGLVIAFKEYYELKRQNRLAGNPFHLRFTMPCLGDRFFSSGNTSGHYFFQDLSVARKIFERHPVRHVDIGSRVDGIVAHVASFRDIEVFDIRPLTLALPSIIFRQADLTHLDNEFRHYCDSLSCLHAIEHFGLGRYGDTIDLYGHVKGFTCLSEVLKPGGTLYFSVPIGPERIDFNSCRVFNIRTILNLAEQYFDVVDFSYVDDAGAFHTHIELNPERVDDNCGCDYGCGIFEFIRKPIKDNT